MYARKAQGLSVSTLIIVALGIIVLIISIVFFSSIVGNSEETIENCDNLGGQCSDTPCAQNGQLENSLGSCGESRYCCMSRGNT